MGILTVTFDDGKGGQQLVWTKDQEAAPRTVIFNQPGTFNIPWIAGECGPITDESIGDVLTTAFEGGSNYWATGVKVDDFKGQDYASQAVGHGAEAVISIDEDTPEVLTREKMVVGIGKAATYLGQTVERFIENHDADDADLAVQFALFGEVVYG